MTKTKLALGVVVAAALLSALLWQQHALEAERAEQARLLAQTAASATAAQSDPQTVSFDAEQTARERAELERLRDEAGKLRAQIDEARARAQTTVVARASATRATSAAEIVIRTADARDSGQATPEALVQSLMWAVSHGATNRIYDMMAFEPGADLKKVESDMKGLRDEVEKARTGMIGPAEVRILSDQAAENNDHWLTTLETHGDGSVGKPERVRLRLTDTGWRLVIGTNGEPVVERLENP